MPSLPIHSQPLAAPAPLAADLSEAQIRELVTCFYGRVQEDPILAPVFATKIAPDAWPSHLDRMTEFWSQVLLRTASYRGNPVAKHAALPELGPHHFERWLELFGATTRDLFENAEAERIAQLAHRMGQGLQNAITMATHDVVADNPSGSR